MGLSSAENPSENATSGTSEETPGDIGHDERVGVVEGEVQAVFGKTVAWGSGEHDGQYLVGLQTRVVTE